MTLDSIERSSAVRCIETAVTQGYMKAPSGFKVSQGNSQNRVQPHSSSCCCIISGGPSHHRRESKEGVVLAVVFFAVSFFVVLYYTISAAREALDYQDEIDAMRDRIKTLKPPKSLQQHQVTPQPPKEPLPFTANPLPPPYTPNPSPPPYTPQMYSMSPQYQLPNVNVTVNIGVPSAPPSEMPSFSPEFEPLDETEHLAALHDIKQVWQGMRNERIAACFCRAVLTAGLALLTTAFVVALLTNSEVILRGIAIGGGGLVALGLLAHCFKVLIFRFGEERQAVDRLMPRIG